MNNKIHHNLTRPLKSKTSRRNFLKILLMTPLGVSLAKHIGISVAQDPPEIAYEIYEKMGPQIDRLVGDEAFQTAVESLDVEGFVEVFNTFTEKVTNYNIFHKRERHIWSAKILTGTVSEELERDFIGSIPEGRQNYLDAFEQVDNMTQLLLEAGFDEVLQEHLTSFTAVLGDSEHPFTQMVTNYFRDIGTSQSMIDEFRQNFGVIHYDFFQAFDGGLAKLREVTQAAVEAQVSILDFTEENGFTYLVGECGPPEWAIVASQILAAAGIAISAWVIVAIIVALLGLLVAICVAAPRGTWVRTACEQLTILLPIFRF